jgi:LmbE family N-acetylglucosaminyl deacetylase
MAHPDDESLGTGGTLARYADEGVETYVVTATRGEAGRLGEERPGPEVMGPLREKELLAAAETLGVTEVSFLDYMDGQLADVDALEATAKIVGHLRRVRPQVVITFSQDGGYGHPDHIAISQFTAAAVVCAADPNYAPPPGVVVDSVPHAVSKFYFMAWTTKQWDAYQAAFGELRFVVDGVERTSRPWEDWSISAVLDTTRYWKQVWDAVSCHQSQITGYRKLLDLPEEYHPGLWGTQEFYRVFSTVNGGREIESCLFEGIE